MFFVSDRLNGTIGSNGSDRSDRDVLLHLSLIAGIGPAVVTLILKNRPSGFALSELYRLGISELRQRFRLSESVAAAVSFGLADGSVLDKELELAEKHSIDLVTIDSDRYPKLLREIHLPPTVLYCKGLPLDNHGDCIAIVGARKATSYARVVIESLTEPLVEAGWTVVSGGARGADSMAHDSVVGLSGRTIAVLGCGLLRCYPSENKVMFRSIVESGGTLVSCFPLMAEPLAGNFPARNRVIAGLSRGVVVVQAAEKSGALITSKFALEQGREVFAIPGIVNDPLSAGCNRLIQQGAKLVCDVDDIFEEFGVTTSKVLHLGAVAEKEGLPAGSKQDELVLHCSTPRSVEELVELVQKSFEEVSDRLVNLQLDGHLEQNFAGLWHRI